jgi:hypothetical protein
MTFVFSQQTISVMWPDSHFGIVLTLYSEESLSLLLSIMEKNYFGAVSGAFL